MFLTVARIVAVTACILLCFDARNAKAQNVQNRPPTIDFIEPLPIDTYAGKNFKICAYIKDQEGDRLRISFKPQRSTLLSISLVKTNRCAWFKASEKRGKEVIWIEAYEIKNPRNVTRLPVTTCNIMDELFTAGTPDPGAYCARL